jgi:hypothetical protein
MKLVKEILQLFALWVVASAITVLVVISPFVAFGKLLGAE